MIWLLGTGNMGNEYAKVLQGLEQEFIGVGRSEERAVQFGVKFNVPVRWGGIDKFLDENPILPKCAIVAVDADQLYFAVKTLLIYGVKKILLEKPGALYKPQLLELEALAKKHNAQVLIGYNRRFYSATLKALEIIAEDGGVSSFNFEFTERNYIIEGISKKREIFETWMYGNSSHVIDLAFYLGGKPQQMKSFSSGKNQLSWHPHSSNYSGAGVSMSGALFSYQANWAAPGRWSVEIITLKNRLIFKPMENLYCQKYGSMNIEQLELNNVLDIQYKPGLFLQVSSFLKEDFKAFKTLGEQAADFGLYGQILDGN